MKTNVIDNVKYQIFKHLPVHVIENKALKLEITIFK